MTKGKKLWIIAVFTAFLCYLAVMLYLLFFQRMGRTSPLGYWEQVRAFTNFVPFRTILEFWNNLQSGYPFLIWQAFTNLAGNLILFVPIGLFLPYYWEKQRKLRWFLPTVILMIVCVEVIQLFSLLGACDVDDLIFNVAGACAGFAIFKLICSILRKRGKITE